MSQTVIGFFDSQSEAQQAIEQLQSKGISRDRIDVSGGGTSTGTAGNRTAENSDVNPVSGSERDENSVRKTSDDRTVDRDGRNTNRFTDFFNNLFGGGDDKDDVERYGNMAERAGAIVTIHAQSAEEAERAADILDHSGALDVDERGSQPGYSPTNTSGNRRSRSRIVNRKLDDNMRLRDL